LFSLCSFVSLRAFVLKKNNTERTKATKPHKEKRVVVFFVSLCVASCLCVEKE